jgi:DNA modification methylase
MIHDGFENAVIPDNTYDLVFTSPPFFDFELYENDKGQSVEKFNTLEKWLHGFMYPYIEKSFKAMTIGGHFGLYISDYTGVSFTKKVFQYIEQNLPNMKYFGDIHYWIKNNPKVVRTMFFWKKIGN